MGHEFKDNRHSKNLIKLAGNKSKSPLGRKNSAPQHRVHVCQSKGEGPVTQLELPSVSKCVKVSHASRSTTTAVHTGGERHRAAFTLVRETSASLSRPPESPIIGTWDDINITMKHPTMECLNSGNRALFGVVTTPPVGKRNKQDRASVRDVVTSEISYLSIWCNWVCGW